MMHDVMSVLITKNSITTTLHSLQTCLVSCLPVTVLCIDRKKYMQICSNKTFFLRVCSFVLPPGTYLSAQYPDSGGTVSPPLPPLSVVAF